MKLKDIEQIVVPDIVEDEKGNTLFFSPLSGDKWIQPDYKEWEVKQICYDDGYLTLVISPLKSKNRTKDIINAIYIILLWILVFLLYYL